MKRMCEVWRCHRLLLLKRGFCLAFCAFGSTERWLLWQASSNCCNNSLCISTCFSGTPCIRAPFSIFVVFRFLFPWTLTPLTFSVCLQGVKTAASTMTRSVLNWDLWSWSRTPLCWAGQGEWVPKLPQQRCLWRNCLFAVTRVQRPHVFEDRRRLERLCVCGAVHPSGSWELSHWGKS